MRKVICGECGEQVSPRGIFQRGHADRHDHYTRFCRKAGQRTGVASAVAAPVTQAVTAIAAVATQSRFWRLAIAASFLVVAALAAARALLH